MAIRKNRPKCTNPAMQELYDEMFPNTPDDEIWKEYKNEKSKIIWPFLHSSDPHTVLEGLIQATQLYVDFYNKTTIGLGSPPIMLTTDLFFLCQSIEPDMKYLHIYMNMFDSQQIYEKLLLLLTAIRDHAYIPMDEVTKKRLQVQFKAFVQKEWRGNYNELYYEFFPEDIANRYESYNLWFRSYRIQSDDPINQKIP
jgi:hypothetical protein